MRRTRRCRTQSCRVGKEVKMSDKALTVEFVTPEKRVFSGKAISLSARTLEGDLGILVDHAPLLGVLVDGKVSIEGVDGSVQELK